MEEWSSCNPPWLQSKLIKADQARREAEQNVLEFQALADGERARLELAARMAKEDSSVRIKTLEETVEKLSFRSDLHKVYRQRLLPYVCALSA